VRSQGITNQGVVLHSVPDSCILYKKPGFKILGYADYAAIVLRTDLASTEKIPLNPHYSLKTPQHHASHSAVIQLIERLPALNDITSQFAGMKSY